MLLSLLTSVDHYDLGPENSSGRKLEIRSLCRMTDGSQSVLFADTWTNAVTILGIQYGEFSAIFCSIRKPPIDCLLLTTPMTGTGHDPLHSTLHFVCRLVSHLLWCTSGGGGGGGGGVGFLRLT